MDNTDLAYLSIAEAAALVAKRVVSPTELTEAVIARAEALDDNLHAYLTRTFDTAREEAKAATEEIAGGNYRGPLHGIPFAIKDIYETAGVETTAGSKLHEKMRAELHHLGFVVVVLRAGCVPRAPGAKPSQEDGASHVRPMSKPCADVISAS